MSKETFIQIDNHFKTGAFFPPGAHTWEQGNAVYEGIFIQKISNKRYIVHAQRHYATNPFLLAEKAEWVFDSLDAAYRKWSNLESGIFD